MAVLSELVELLKRWDVWKRIEAAPDRIDALEARVKALEERLQRCPGEACPACGALEFRTAGQVLTDGEWGHMGGVRRTLRCTECNHSEIRLDLPKR